MDKKEAKIDGGIMKRVIIILFGLIFISCSNTKTIEVFHKNKKPSLKTLAQVKEVLSKYEVEYNVSYHLITAPETLPLIQKYNLPDTHFPFAVVINGKYSAKLDNQQIDFVHFPLFMHGIGRHEGNWSLIHLETALQNNALLISENILLEHPPHHDDHEPCEGE